MLPRRLHRSAGPRRPADWPPPSGHPTRDSSGHPARDAPDHPAHDSPGHPARDSSGRPRPLGVTRLLAPALLGLLLVSPLAGASAIQPRLLGCRVASVDQLLPRAAFSSLAGGADCPELCTQQEALLAAVSPSWCFCLNQPASAARLTANCSGTAPPGLELLHIYSLTEPVTWDGRSPGFTSSQDPLASGLVFGTLRLVFVRCATSSGENNDTPKQVDLCVHTCSTDFSGGFMALGPARGVSEQYECHCSAEDEFGASVDADTCDQHCSRYGEVMDDTTCGGETADGTTVLSVYRLTEESPGSTPTPVTTRRSTGHSPSVSGITDSACPDRGVHMAGGSCYRVEAVNGDYKPDNPRTYEDVVDACTNINVDHLWRPWAIETQEELDGIFQYLTVADFDDMATSGTVQADGSTVEWADWSGDTPADWLAGLTTGTPQPGSVLVWGNVQSAAVEADTTLTYYEPTELPSVLGVICELPMAGTTVTTPESTTSSPTTTAVSSTTALSSTTPDTTSSPTSTTLPSSTPEPGPETPDDVINDLINDLDEKPSSDITDTDVIDTVDQLDDILEAQMDMSYDLPKEKRLESDKKFTRDLVKLVDTLLSATNAWKNMSQSQSAETASKLMGSTEAAGFLLANSTAVVGSDDIIETAKTSIVLSSSSVERNYGGGFQFPKAKDSSTSWIQLPPGYANQNEDLESNRLPQVGMLYRSEVMSILLSPSNNSMGDARKRLNSPVLSFSLGGVGRRVQLPGQGARMQLQYALTEREPAQREVWRHLHPGEEPSAVRGTAVCAYWDESLSAWSTDGCRLDEGSSSKHHASCVCSHLTSFSILMDYHDYVGTPQSLNILTWVLGSLSIIGLVITWIVFTCNRSLHCTRTTITRNLCATYAVGLTLLLTLMDRRLVYLEPPACTAVGMAIHYSFLAVFAWTMVEGMHLYKVLRHVFEPKSNSMTRYYIYGYLIPALIIIITTTVALTVDENAYVRDEFCWLTIPYFIWFYNGPIAVVLIMNMFVLILAYRSAATLKVNQLRAKKEKMKRWMKGWFSLSCLLGVQWAIGYIYVDGSNVFDYVFTALNCSQGLLIFIFHCVLREKTRQILLGRFSTAKRSTMMNSVYGQMVIAERKKQEYRQSRMSHDTCVTTLSNAASPANSESPDSSPASERSSSSSQGSGSSKRSARSSSKTGRQSLTRGATTDGQTSGSLRGRVNLAFQPDEPWAPLPDISEEADGAGSPRHEPVPPPSRGSRAGRPPSVMHIDGVEIYRSNSVAALRHGKAH